jgi:hypothetical protein
MKAWKAFEASAAALFNGKRFWANSGARLDFEGWVWMPIDRSEENGDLKVDIHGQCKLVKNLSLEALTRLAEEKDVDVVCVKVRRGKGKPSPTLVVFTEENYRRLHSGTISTVPTEAPCVPSSPSPTSRLSENTSRLPNGQHPSSGLQGQEFLPESPNLWHGLSGR